VLAQGINSARRYGRSGSSLRVEVRRLALDDVRGKVEHFFRKLEVRDVLEIGFFVADLFRTA
jgi:hypothetical protein